MKDPEAIKKRLRTKKIPPQARSLSSGSTLLNLSLTGQVDAGWDCGCYYLLVGSSSSGKTFLVLQSLAEASINPAFTAYRLIYDAPERGARMNVEHYFGKKLAERIELVHSRTVQEFYYRVDDCYKTGKPFVYALDSESSLSSDSEAKTFQENKTAHRRGKKAKGSYGDGKARIHAADLRQAVSKISETDSLILMVAQTRDNIGFDATFNPETRSGGRALTFYATAEIWMKERAEIRKRIRGEEEKQGAIIQCRVKKNRDTGREPTILLRHYLSHGFDDVESLIDWLLLRDGGRWKEADGKLGVTDFSFLGTREEFIGKVHEEKLLPELKNLVTKIWRDIDAALVVNRPKKYG